MRRILLTALLIVSLVMSLNPEAARAQTLKLSPGFYTGKFLYSAYSILVDNQTFDGQSIFTNSVSNVDIEGTLILKVDKRGNIAPGAQILVTLAPAYNIHTFSATELNCSVTSYISAESRGKVTTKKTGSSAGVISADINLENAKSLYFKTMGVSEDCQPLADEDYMLEGLNKHINALNKLKTMQFIVVRANDSSMNGSISINGVVKTLSTPGGYIKETEKGVFRVFKTDQLSSLEGDDPLGGVTLAPAGDWRDK